VLDLDRSLSQEWFIASSSAPDISRLTSLSSSLLSSGPLDGTVTQGLYLRHPSTLIDGSEMEGELLWSFVA
jgi:hypothetical protein